MKIYCAGPIRGDRSYAQSFQEIVLLVHKLGHIALTELAPQPEEEPVRSDEMIYRRDMGWLDQARALVAEVSAPSLGVGYEIAYALHIRKIPVLCLRHGGSRSLSAMLSGNFSRFLSLETYQTKEELEGILSAFLKKCT
jgi:hypothetical protein